ncbi:hypothetical protein DFH94DRAFT_776859 [Russula ochroleuca]|jgi:hypothetical protein|uniref:Uncharacterized protein n=1 Tax=Russula ochroleuca TaxID=152965 RepID=A0A9P5JXW4_9AGAM|nr:hypothetical protein DFH94DRAFT_776859 [Russula ochroleuca]
MSPGELRMPPRALVVHPRIAVLASALLVALNGLQVLPPPAVLSDFVNAIDASLATAFGTLLESPWVEAGTATAFFAAVGSVREEGIDRGCVWMQRW